MGNKFIKLTKNGNKQIHNVYFEHFNYILIEMAENFRLKNIIASERETIKDSRKALKDIQKINFNIQKTVTSLSSLINEVEDLYCPIFNTSERISAGLK